MRSAPKQSVRIPPERHRTTSAKFCILLYVFVLAGTSSALGQREEVLYRFSSGRDGSAPMTSLVSDPSGNLYGATYGGNQVFELSPPATPGAPWTKTALYYFRMTHEDDNVISVLTFDASGNLYGAASQDGASGQGSVFRLTPPTSRGGGWTENVLYSFNGTVGSVPYGGVIFDKAGNIFGTTRDDYVGSYGTVYELSPPAAKGGAWTGTLLYRFAGSTDGCGPNGKLVFGANGALFGTAVQCGGTQNLCFFGCGTVFELVPPALPGGTWTEQTIYEFQGGTDGDQPVNGLVADGKGNFYGATQAGGGSCTTDDFACGTVFELSPPTAPGGNWTEAIVYTFTGYGDGEGPQGGVIIDRAGNLYGATTFGGNLSCYTNDGCGAVFELSPPADQGGLWKETTLHTFTGPTDGAIPFGGLTLYEDTVLYGTTDGGGNCILYSCGTVFSVFP